ncbi:MULTISPECIES: 2-dehydro-3-deoxy-6-phosphogalactonate aldolase [unclassified Lysobacter]|uniref:2-dehydro-3-deoxy-6-phosphogalactonate aldolase n=1 Tax=unclassified Lysobacter TaxID=2635362 RepID=UPI001BE62A5A|nr:MULTISPECIES: 2-dehydro-3-deoxy-6-phosphogalactonate aldolase [unclassified Lysobacter]MBT2745778.1 2-dehydro-3-deoxy-6-phosphogalactonate aldolase [Lysobacter sp. ISL-42]MBT2749663.1 2-dehydro-3-deoxy-6-phosphogalactonate aldolase [Lysobacter sp. ISL-50]MBT2777618.1 2-dehydro-3-deoxy-6-phosphogalactonate aldolase [Lysobacter sp. ISL-54]MBT2782106.1 2-dehydro-3-deoxy-6-phosphogalactonate aldolase [Lysobacter sp. ISL-52]
MDWRTQRPLIAILRGITPAQIEAHVEALIDAGISLIEIPTNSPQWLRSVELAVAAAGTRALIGAGTVLNRDDVDALAATGASLMVTPNTDVAVIRHAVERGLICAAGFSTPSEAFAALSAGAQALKLFPAASFGPGYVRAIRAVLPPQVPVFAVGGVTPDNLPGYLQSGCAGAGLGSDLYAPGQAPSVTRERGGLFVDAYQSARP